AVRRRVPRGWGRRDPGRSPSAARTVPHAPGAGPRRTSAS
ncbi:MAG: hypothetical protein AVDCRST_MAG54-4905, partial [uncultured Actinomycetospora sp.]